MVTFSSACITIYKCNNDNNNNETWHNINKYVKVV